MTDTSEHDHPQDRALLFSLVSFIVGLVISTTAFWFTIRKDLVSRDEIQSMVSNASLSGSASYERDRRFVEESLRNFGAEIRTLGELQGQMRVESERINGKIETLRAEVRQHR